MHNKKGKRRKKEGKEREREKKERKRSGGGRAGEHDKLYIIFALWSTQAVISIGIIIIT